MDAMCIDRQEHLEDLSDQYGVELEIVCALADLLGEGEDYDGLVNAVEDYAIYGC